MQFCEVRQIELLVTQTILCFSNLFSSLNLPGGVHSEQQQKFLNQSSGPSYRKDQYFSKGQSRGERGRGRGGWQGGHQSVSEEMPRFITGLYTWKGHNLSVQGNLLVIKFAIFVFVQEQKLELMLSSSGFPDFLQNTEVVVNWSEWLAVVQWILSDFWVEKLHLLVVRDMHFGFCLPA